MARFVVLLFLAAVVCTIHAFPQHQLPENCGPNQVYDTCGNPCEATCQNPEPKSCVFMCKIGCRCVQGFVRSHPDGECIPQPQCLLRD